jgi:hypothetical protein
VTLRRHLWGCGGIARSHSKSQHSEVKGHHRPGSFTPEETCHIIMELGLRVGLGNLKKRYISYIYSNQTTVPRLSVRSPVNIPSNLPHITNKYTNLFSYVLVSHCLKIQNMINTIYITIHAPFLHSYHSVFSLQNFIRYVRTFILYSV